MAICLSYYWSFFIVIIFNLCKHEQSFQLMVRVLWAIPAQIHVQNSRNACSMYSHGPPTKWYGKWGKTVIVRARLLWTIHSRCVMLTAPMLTIRSKWCMYTWTNTRNNRVKIFRHRFGKVLGNGTSVDTGNTLKWLNAPTTKGNY